jgi:hypothetical protein
VERNTYRTVVLVITLIRNSPLIEMKTLIACVVLCYCYLLCQGAPGAKGRAEPSAKRQSPESESSLSPAPAPQKKLFSLLFAQAAAPKCSETSSFISLFEYFFFPRCSLFARSFLIRGPQGTLHHSNTHHTLSLVPHVLYHTVSYRTTILSVPDAIVIANVAQKADGHARQRT